MLRTCFSTAPSLTTSSRAIAVLDRPSAISASTSRSRGVSGAERVLRPGAGRAAGPPPPGRARAAVGDPVQRLQEVGDVGHPVLEQVADRARPVGQQVVGVRDLDVLRQHQHRRARAGGADRDRGPQALVGVRRRHPYVDDADVGPVGRGGGDERGPVADRGHDVVAVLGEQPDQPLPQQDRVVGDDNLAPAPSYGQGSSALTMVGPPGGLLIHSWPPTACSRSASPARPWPLATWAPPDPSSATVHGELRRPRAGPTTRHRVAPLCLATLVSASATVK